MGVAISHSPLPLGGKQRARLQDMGSEGNLQALAVARALRHSMMRTEQREG